MEGIPDVGGSLARAAVLNHYRSHTEQVRFCWQFPVGSDARQNTLAPDVELHDQKWQAKAHTWFENPAWVSSG